LKEVLLADKNIPPPQGDRPDFPGKVRLALPENIYAVAGMECNIYFDNVVVAINPANYVFDASCPAQRKERDDPGKGMALSERWTWTPKPEEAGDYSIQIEVVDESNAVVARGRSLVHVVPADAGSGKAISLLCIGDSITHALNSYTGHLLELCKSPGNPRLRLIGGNQPDPARPENCHEGYGGWSAERFVTQGSAIPGDHTRRGSPFLYPDAKGSPRLDFARYCREFSEGKAPDFATIFLGGNDVFFDTDQTIDATVEQVLGFYDKLIEMVLDFDGKTQVGILPQIPSPVEQNVFGISYGCMKTRWQHKRNQRWLAEGILARYQGREKERIWVVPVDINLDCAHGYPTVSGPWNVHSDQAGSRQSNAHPVTSGQRQVADALFAWLKAVLASRR